MTNHGCSMCRAVVGTYTMDTTSTLVFTPLHCTLIGVNNDPICFCGTPAPLPSPHRIAPVITAVTEKVTDESGEDYQVTEVTNHRQKYNRGK